MPNTNFPVSSMENLQTKTELQMNNTTIVQPKNATKKTFINPKAHITTEQLKNHDNLNQQIRDN